MRNTLIITGWCGGAGGHRGRVVADWSRGAVAGRQVKAAQGGWRFFKVGLEMK